MVTPVLIPVYSAKPILPDKQTTWAASLINLDTGWLTKTRECPRLTHVPVASGSMFAT